MESVAKQMALLAAGCQPWNFQVASASGRRFAYCATLSVYIFEVIVIVVIVVNCCWSVVFFMHCV